GEPEGAQRGRPPIDPYMQCQPVGALRLPGGRPPDPMARNLPMGPILLGPFPEGNRQGGAARAGGQDRVGKPAPGQFVHERGRESGRRVHAAASHWAAASARARHGAGSVSHADRRSASIEGRRTRRAPSSPASGSPVTSPASPLIVARPPAKGGSGRGAERASPAASPPEASTALEPPPGSPPAPPTAGAARPPPSGWALITTMSAAPAARTVSGSSARR